MSKIASSLREEGLLSEASYERVLNEKANLFSLHWELRTLLYLGVLLFTTGLGIVVYKNIETIGHQAIVAFIGIACIGCFYYCFSKGKPYTHQRVEQETPLFDYVLLLGGLLLVTFEGYLQYQYEIFGTKYGLATMIPGMLFAFLAYRFDHLGILSMAITAIAAWLGLTITPLHLFESFDRASVRLIYTAEVLGIILVVFGWILSIKKIKPHFFFTYINFASHLLFIATLGGLFLAEGVAMLLWFMWLVILFVASVFFAKEEKSFYFLLIAIIYGYIGLTYLVFQTPTNIDTFFATLYFIGSCAGIIYFLINHKKIVARVFGQNIES